MRAVALITLAIGLSACTTFSSNMDKEQIVTGEIVLVSQAGGWWNEGASFYIPLYTLKSGEKTYDFVGGCNSGHVNGSPLIQVQLEKYAPEENVELDAMMTTKPKWNATACETVTKSSPSERET